MTKQMRKNNKKNKLKKLTDKQCQQKLMEITIKKKILKLELFRNLKNKLKESKISKT